MACGEFYVERQYWARFPKVLIMCRKHGRMENGNCAVERMRYVPERTCENKNKSVTSFWCSKCDAATSDGFADVGGKLARFNYCPNCGCKVVGE